MIILCKEKSLTKRSSGLLTRQVNSSVIVRNINMDYKLSIPIKLLYGLTVKFILWVKKNETKNNGEVNISKVIHQGKVFSCLKDYKSNSLSVEEIPEYLLKLTEQTIDPRYKKSGNLSKHDKLPNEEKVKILINNTRISTFFVITDGDNILLHNREKTNDEILTLENNKYDMFGSVSFENSTIKLKIKNNDFFQSKIKSIKCIPGFAFEDTIEPEDNLFGRQTVIMIGLVLYLSKKDFDKAESTKTSIVEKFHLNDTPNERILTSKAKLGIDFLRTSKL